MKNFKLIFDGVMVKQLKKVSKNNAIKNILSRIFDKIEELGPRAGRLIDSQLHIYEIKMKSPPIRLYYKHDLSTNEIYVFEYEMKTSEGKQNKTIKRIKKLLLKS